jgi:hypothetical protein
MAGPFLPPCHGFTCFSGGQGEGVATITTTRYEMTAEQAAAGLEAAAPGSAHGRWWRRAPTGRRESQARGLPASSNRASTDPDECSTRRWAPRHRHPSPSRRWMCSGRSAATVDVSLALLSFVAFHGIRSAAAATCDITCTCTSFGMMEECTSPTPACGFTPCKVGPSVLLGSHRACPHSSRGPADWPSTGPTRLS